MFVTVAVCTRNRAPSLARTLASIEAAQHPACDWEILIIDNGSTDDTQHVIAAFAERLPIRMQIETRSGVANARNAAVAAATGEYIVWTDDDVVVQPNWLTAYVSSFSAHPSADLFGGRIVPVLEEPITEWFQQISPRLEELLAVRDLSDEPMVISKPEQIPYCANCAVRSSVQKSFPFDPARGPGTPYFGEETTSFKAMLVSGHEARWVPGSCVQHMISSKRQTLAYIRWWYEGLGRTVVWEGAEILPGPRVLGAPRWLWRSVITKEFRFRLARLTSAPDVWARRLIDVSVDWGKLRHYRSLAGEDR